ncbi:MAG: DUF5620 domain-containing protein [Oscillospiraceae bacterium]|nr:DUF5620 domain-containing protein [Oscillospiraceae bacterium]
MNSRTMTNRMKAAAVAAVMCISATSAVLPSVASFSSMLTVSAAAVDTLSVKDVYEGMTADIAKSGLKSITLHITADYTGNFSYGFGIGIDADPYWMEWDGKGWVDTKGGTVEVEGISVPVTKGEEVTITIDTSELSLKYADAYNSKYDGTFQFRNYYSGTGGTITIDKIVANETPAATEASETETETETEKDTDDTKATDTTEDTDTTEESGTTEATETESETETESSAPVSGTVAELTDDTKSSDSKYRGLTADLAEKGIKNITITLDTGDYTGNVSYGFGIGIADSPYWMEWDGSGWVDTSDGKTEVAGTSIKPIDGEIVIVIDTSKLDLKYKDEYNSKYDGEFEFRNYYSDGNTITIKSIEVNSNKEATPVTEEEPTEDEHSLSNKSGQTTNRKSGSWEFTDNGDGTGTMTATQARQIEFEKPLTLTQGYDEDYYASLDINPVEGEDPLNSHKFNYSDFGLSNVGAKGNIMVESIMATIQSQQSVKNFMYGGGLNVENKSPADTESAKAEKGVATSEFAGYWYNDMGQDKIEEFEAAGVEFGVTPHYGYYLSSEDNQLGKYFSVFWDVPEEVKPYETAGAISFQYWYGVEDAEEYTEIPAVDLVGGVITYTETQTFKYTTSKKVDINKKIKASDMSGEISFADDLGLAPNEDVHAVVFTVSADTDLDKLVYGIGASVGDDWMQWADETAKWNYVVTNTEAGDIEIAWMPPASIDLNEAFGNIQFGYWYGGQGETELDSITLKSVEVFYKEKAVAQLWGDADCNGKVDIVDVILMNKTIMGKDNSITEQGIANGDLNMNEVPDSVDSLNILKLIVGLITDDQLPLTK